MRKAYILLLCLMVCGCNDDRDYGSEIRPDDFPDFLTAPENARTIRYATPQSDITLEGTYSLTYIVDEEFPPDNTISYIHSELSAAGFILLKHRTLDLGKRAFEWFENPDHRQPNHAFLVWESELGTKTDYRRIHVALSYHYAAENPILTELSVSIGYSTEDSPYSIRMKRYKERFPEEFECSKENEPWPGTLFEKQGD